MFEPLKYYDLQCVEFLHTQEAISAIRRINIEFADAVDKEMHEAIIREAQRNGITDLYIFDRQFVINALREAIKKEARTI